MVILASVLFAIALVLAVVLPGVWPQRHESSQIISLPTATMYETSEKLCDQPPEAYLLNAQISLGLVESPKTSYEDKIRSPNEWMQLYQICSDLQKKSAR